MEMLLDLTVKSTLLLLLTAVVVLAMRRAAAASRHLVWTGVFCAIAILPVARLTLPALRIPILKSAPIVDESRPVVVSLPIVELSQPSAAPSTSAPTAAAPVVVADSRPATLPPVALPRRPVTLADVIALLWISGVVVLALRHIAGWLALRRIVARAGRVTDSRVLSLLDQAACDFRISRPIDLLSYESDGLPCTFGVRRPTILLPSSLLDSASATDSRLGVILVHEVAHVARFDALSDRISQVATMVFWFNPLMWAAARQARIERERAADDAVLAAGTRPSDYATDLLSIAAAQSMRFMSSTLPMAASGLERRVRAILDARVRRGRRSAISVVLAVVLVATMLPVSAAKLVARATPAVEVAESLLSASTSPTPDVDLGPVPVPVSASVPHASAGAGLQQTTSPASVFLIGADDLLSLDVWRSKEYSGEMVVGQDGRITLPGAGVKIMAAGLSVDQLKAQIVAALVPKSVASSDVSLQVKQINSRRRYWTADQQAQGQLREIRQGQGQQGQVQQGQQGQGQQGQQVQGQQGQQGQGQQGQQGQTAIPTTRVAMIKFILGRAQNAWSGSLKKVEIGTAARMDTVIFETTLAQIEQMYLAAQGAQEQFNALRVPEAITASELDLRRARMATALRNLDTAEVRFDNGLISNMELADALKAAATAAAGLPLVAPASQNGVSPADAMFTTANFPGSAAGDRNSAKALYDLLTGRVSSIGPNGVAPSPMPVPSDADLLAALKNAMKIPSETERADALIGATRYPLTPEMVAAYVAAGGSINDASERARVFAQPIRVKSPGKSPQYYWQR